MEQDPEVTSILQEITQATTDEERIAIEQQYVRETDNSARDGDLDLEQVQQ